MEKNKNNAIEPENKILSHNTQNSATNIRPHVGSTFDVAKKNEKTAFAENLETESKYSRTTIKY